MWPAIIILSVASLFLITTVVNHARGKGKNNDSSYDPHSGGER